MEEQCSGSNPSSSGSGRGGDEWLETSRSDTPMHLLKCPPLVDRAFKFHQQQWQLQQQQNPNPIEFSESGYSLRPVGKVTLAIDPLNTNGEPEFTMELAGNESDNIPKCYSMNMSRDITPMCAFSQTSNGQVSLEGKVVSKFDMKPQSDSIKEYGKLCRERTKKCMIKPRQLQVIDNDRNMRPMPGMIGFLTSSSKEKKKTVALKGTDTKRTRRDRGEMEEIMFKLMERQPNWTLRQLIQETDQPEQFLKDILKDLCVYNNKGANQGTYELKPEYKKSNDETNT